MVFFSTATTTLAEGADHTTNISTKNDPSENFCQLVNGNEEYCHEFYQAEISVQMPNGNDMYAGNQHSNVIAQTDEQIFLDYSVNNHILDFNLNNGQQVTQFNAITEYTDLSETCDVHAMYLSVGGELIINRQTVDCIPL